ncbi:molybdenum ABC transporter substrate-binding protein [Mucilaginibacter sp. PAMC 26640]|nr:molybdenum ABC transporter substrate-binding protein [Mucilaginibacter sp. PAMC 26640]
MKEFQQTTCTRRCGYRIIAVMMLLVCSAGLAHAQNLRIAIAANLQPVMKVLQKDFKQRSGLNIDAISGPSGNLTTQIKNGAPFDVFLSADTGFPEELFKSGFAVNKPVVYAQGILILCSRHKLGAESWKTTLLNKNVSRLAIGNPAIAPYGKAAKEVLTHEGIYKQLKPKLVFGESITQVNTYIATDAVEAGFTSLSFYKENSSRMTLFSWPIDPATYSPILQGMVLLKHAKNNADAKKFYDYILSPPARKIFAQYGYHLQ